ncbi:MAG: RHS repeat domain-containing protein [Rhizomicrobium sp.]
MRDPLYNVTSYAYDGDGRRIAVSNLAIQPGPLSQASYTANGLPHVLTDAAGHGVTLGYDGLDRPAATTYPDASAQTLSYDADGNVVTRLTRAGDTLSYAYDTRNLLCSKAVAAVATPCTATSSANPTVWYAHDLDGRSLGARDNGAVLAAVGVQASYAMAARYDALNRPTNVAWSPVQAQAPPPASSVTFGHGYDAGKRCSRPAPAPARPPRWRPMPMTRARRCRGHDAGNRATPCGPFLYGSEYGIPPWRTA